MNYKDFMDQLSPQEKVDLAVRLTQAAMAIVRFTPHAAEKDTLQVKCGGAATETLMIFGDILRFLESGEEHPANGRVGRWEWQ